MNRLHLPRSLRRSFCHGMLFTLASIAPLDGVHAQFKQAGAKLVPLGGIGTPRMGWSVSLSGDGRTAVVGASSDANAAGGAFVYVRQGDVWVQQGGKLYGTGSDGNAAQGSEVAISADGNTIAISGESDAESNGAVWVFARSGNTWVQQGPKLVGAGATWRSYQGSALALSHDGTTMLVGAQFDSNGTGATHVFVRSGNTWTQQGPKLVGTGGVEHPYQGSSVCLSGDGNIAAIGAASDNWDSGAVWIFRRVGGVWTQQGEKLTAPVGSGTGSFGSGVALSADGSRLLVGAFSDNGLTGCARVYEHVGNAWVQQGGTLIPSDIGYHSQFGRWVGLSADGNTAVIGGHGDESYRGATWVYSFIGGAWHQNGTKLVGSGGSWDAQQGHVAISADATTLLTGAVNDSGGIGAAWVFVHRSVDVTVTDPITQQGPAPGGLVRLVNRIGSLTASGTTDDSGHVSFYAVAPDTGYVCTVHYPGTDTTAEFDTLSWGSVEPVTLVSGRTATIVCERNAPRITSLDVIDPATGMSVIGSGVYTKFPLRLSLTVRNGHALHPAEVRGLFYLSNDTGSVERTRLLTAPVDVPPDSVRVLQVMFTPLATGSYRGIAGAMTGPEGEAEATDVLIHRSTPLFTASLLPLPGAVALAGPAGNAADQPLSLTLRWHPAARAARYHVQISADTATWNSVMLDDSTVTDTSRIVNGLAYAHAYRWRVRALNITGAGTWSEERAFRTTAIDPTRLAVLIAPLHGATVGDSTATLRWTKPTGAVSFRIQVSLDSFFVAPGAVKEFITTDTFVVARPLTFQTPYWWRVTARYDSMTSAGPTGAWRFITGLPLPGTVLLVHPQHLYGTLDTTTFVWRSAGPRVTRYWFEQGLDSLFAFVSIDSMLTDTIKFMHVWGDPKVMLGRCYWRVRARNASGWGAFSDVRKVTQLLPGAVERRPEGVPDRWVLEQNYPNPFNPTTVIRFGLPERARVELAVFNMLGQQVVVLQDGELEAGFHDVRLDAHGMSSGVYLYRLHAATFTETRRLILLR